MEVGQKLILSGKTTLERLNEVYGLEVGDIFKIESEYEEVMSKIEYYVPESIGEFEVFPINPGTSLYTMYGPDHLVVTVKKFVEEPCLLKENGQPLLLANYTLLLLEDDK